MEVADAIWGSCTFIHEVPCLKIAENRAAFAGHQFKSTSPLIFGHPRFTMSSQLDTDLFNLKFAAKQMRKESEKMAKDEAKEKALLKKAIEKGQIEVARTHGSSAIQCKNMSLQMLQMSSRIDGCSKRLEQAIRLNQVSKTMSSVVQSMGTSLKSMQPDKIALSMGAFEKAFESIEVSVGAMTGAMDMTTATMVPKDEVDMLIGQIASENQLEIRGLLQAPGSKGAAAAPVAAPAASDLEARLAALKDD